MLAQVVDAVAVVDLAVLALDVVGTQTVLHHHQRDVVAVVDLVEGVAQTNGVDLPAPVGSLQVGVLFAGGDVAADVCSILMGGDAVGHVVAEGVEVHRALLQDGSVLRLLENGDIVLGKVPLHIIGILAPHMHIGGEPVQDLHLLLGRHHIGRVAGHGIAGNKADHAAHLELGVVCVGVADRLGTCHEHMVQCLKTLLLVVRHIGGGAFKATHGAGVQQSTQRHSAGVDLIEGEPVLYLVLVSLKDHLAVVRVKLDELPGCPAVVLFHQSIGQLVVADGHQRLNAVLLAAVKDPVVELQTLFVGLGLHAGGEDTGPVDGGAEGLEAHLGKEGNVLLVVVVEVDRLMAGVQPVRADGGGDPLGHRMGTVGAHIRHAGTLAVHIPCTLELVGGTGAAPQKVIAENAHVFSPLLCLSFFVLRKQAKKCPENKKTPKP